MCMGLRCMTLENKRLIKLDKERFAAATRQLVHLGQIHLEKPENSGQEAPLFQPAEIAAGCDEKNPNLCPLELAA